MNAPATVIDFQRQTVEVSDQRLGKLRIFNLVMGLLHLISGSLMVVLGNDFELDFRCGRGPRPAWRWRGAGRRTRRATTR